MDVSKICQRGIKESKERVEEKEHDMKLKEIVTKESVGYFDCTAEF